MLFVSKFVSFVLKMPKSEVMQKHPITRIFLTISFIFSIFFGKNIPSIQAQNLTRLNVPFEMGGKSLPMALVGGLNSPQFSSVDLNNDKRNDLVVFDRNSNVVLTFLNGGKANTPDWTFAPEFATNFPPLNNWALLRDFNNDGAMDIFTLTSVTTAGNSIRVFKGRFQNGRLAFDRMTFGINGDILKYPDSRGFFLNIYANVIDIPAFDDLDGDGDTDILSFENGGGKVYYYRNRSVELGFGRDTLIYELADDCWGRFFDNGFQSKPTLGTRTVCATGLRKKDTIQVQTRGTTAHPGASLTTYDRDGDGDKDVLISGILFNNMTALTNGGDKTTAWMNAAEENFPPNTEGVNISNFPAAYFADVDNDARADLLVSPSSTSFAENRAVSWFYKNTGTAQVPVFTFQKKTFLVEDMIDLGEGANPTFVDVDADGLLDLIVGNTSFYLSGGDREARLFYFKNIGTKKLPRYRLENDNWLNFKALSNGDNYDFAPAFGDLDGDGDLDLLVGENAGSLFFVENRAGAGQPLSMATPQANWRNIDAGRNAKPQIIDLNRDGLPDIVVGTASRELNFFQNTGTRTQPTFPTKPTLTELGKIKLGLEGDFGSAAAPFIIDLNKKFFLFAGSRRGEIQIFDGINNPTDSFKRISGNYGDLRQGAFSTVALADIDDDNILEIVVGSLRGGFSIFKTTYKTDGTTPAQDIDNQEIIQIYPNPTSEGIWVKMGDNLQSQWTFQIFNTVGQLLKSGKSTSVSEQFIPLNGFQTGVYFLTIEKNGRKQTLRFVKN